MADQKTTELPAVVTPVDADIIYSVQDVATTPVSKKITWTVIKAFLKTYFDTLYAATLGANDNYVTDAEKVVIGNTSGTNSGNETTTSVGALINGATAKTTPVDADMVPLMDSAASNVVKKLSWANIKATLKTYFDTLYQAAGSFVPTTRSLTIGGVTYDLSADRTWAGGGSSLWTMPTGATRVSNTTFTVTGDQTAIFAKGVIVKWTEGGTIRTGMVDRPSTVSTNTTVTIIGDTMASIDASSLKYCMLGAEMFKKRFAYAGTLGVVATGIANTITATEPCRLIGADLWVGYAGTTNSTTIDININGTTAFTTKPTLATTVQSAPFPFTADTNKSLALGDDLTLDLDAIQTTPAIDLYVDVILFPTRYLNLA